MNKLALLAKVGAGLGIVSLTLVACTSGDDGSAGAESAVVSGGKVGAGCGSDGLSQCAPGLSCIYPESAQCGTADQAGKCFDGRGVVCTALYDPVCGCDGKTYSNECMANGAGMSVKSKGACAPSELPPSKEGDACGADGLGPCAEGLSCIYDRAAQCGTAGQAGKCFDGRVAVCSALYDPVCGCDGKTYSNECMANGAGMSVKSAGPCP